MAASESTIYMQTPDSDVFAEKPQQTEVPVSEDPNAPFSLKFFAFIAVLLASITDGLYYSLSMLKFGCEVDTESFSKISSESKFDNLTNNWGKHKGILIAFLVLIPTTVLLSVLGTKKLDLNETLQKIWAYLRRILSAFKNARKAVVSTAFIAQAFAHSTHFYRWANPIGIGVGLLCVANAIWLQRVEEERNSFIKDNVDMLKSLNEDPKKLGPRPTAARHSRLKQGAIYAAVFGDGLTDGIYLYACLFAVIGLSTAVFPPSLLIAATVTLVVLTTLSIISKLNAEYKKSCSLELSAVNVDIAYLEKKKKLTPEEFSSDEAKELASLTKKHAKLSETVNSDNKSFLFSAGRQTVMGFKNAAAAGVLLLMIPGVDIAAETAFILAKTAGLLYALFLAGEEVINYIKSTKKKQSPRLNPTENEKTIAVDSGAHQSLTTETPAQQTEKAPPLPQKAIAGDTAAEKPPSIMGSFRNLFFSPKPKETTKTATPETDFLNNAERKNITVRPLKFNPISC